MSAYKTYKDYKSNENLSLDPDVRGSTDKNTAPGYRNYTSYDQKDAFLIIDEDGNGEDRLQYNYGRNTTYKTYASYKEKDALSIDNNVNIPEQRM
jgi:hypothetical protein